MDFAMIQAALSGPTSDSQWQPGSGLRAGVTHAPTVAAACPGLQAPILGTM